MKDTKHIRQDFHSVAWVMPQGWHFGVLGVPRGVIFFFKHGHVAYQIDGDDEQNRMQVQFSSLGQTGDRGVMSKGQISLNFYYHVNSKIFIPNFVCVLTNKDRKHIAQNFDSVAGVGLGGAGLVKNLSMGICDGAPSTAHSSISFLKFLQRPRTYI